MFILLNLTQVLFSSVIFLTAIPAPISYFATLLLPAQGINLLLKIYLSMESKKEVGLSWSNIDEEVMKNVPRKILFCMILSLFIFTILTLWAFPLKNTEDGRRRSLCYCLSSSYYRDQEKEN